MTGSDFTLQSLEDQTDPDYGKLVERLRHFRPPDGPPEWPRDPWGRWRWIREALPEFHQSKWARIRVGESVLPRGEGEEPDDAGGQAAQEGEGEEAEDARGQATHDDERQPVYRKEVLPRFLPSRSTPPDKRMGRPPRIEEKRDRCVRIACDADLDGFTRREIDHRCGFRQEKWRSSKTADSYVRDGRKVLHEQGVLPWALWPSGKVPNRWWSDDHFLNGLAEWAVAGKVEADDRFRRLTLRTSEGRAPKKNPCPNVPFVESDRIIAFYVQFVDGLREGSLWRSSKRWDELYREARALGFE